MNTQKIALLIALLAGLLAVVPAQAADTSALQAKLDLALQDEYHARDFYAAVLEQYGDVRPFANIIRGEERHIDALLGLYEAYGLTAPEDAHAGSEYSFTSLADAAEQALAAEEANAGLYDELLDGVTDENVIAVFEQLQWASQERHLPALQNYVENGGQHCTGNGYSRGQGNGNGNGKGNGNGNRNGNGKGKRGHSRCNL